MATTLSDSTGHYEVVLEVAGKFSGLESLISRNSPDNLKYQRAYSGYDTFMNGKKCGCDLRKDYE
jgi:hypothetical protein